MRIYRIRVVEKPESRKERNEVVYPPGISVLNRPKVTPTPIGSYFCKRRNKEVELNTLTLPHYLAQYPEEERHYVTLDRLKEPYKDGTRIRFNHVDLGHI